MLSGSLSIMRWWFLNLIFTILDADQDVYKESVANGVGKISREQVIQQKADESLPSHC